MAAGIRTTKRRGCVSTSLRRRSSNYRALESSRGHKLTLRIRGRSCAQTVAQAHVRAGNAKLAGHLVRAGPRPVGAIAKLLQSIRLVPRQPRVHRLSTHPPGRGHFSDALAAANDFLDLPCIAVERCSATLSSLI